MVSMALGASLCLLPASARAKHRHRAGVSHCQQRVAAQIRAAHPSSRGSSFNSDVQRTPYGNNAVTISGSGYVRTSKGRNRGFTYSCVYNQRSAQLSRVKYSIR